MPAPPLIWYVSLWNYAYYDDPKDLDQVLHEIAVNGFGVELWPYFVSLQPYRTTIPGRPGVVWEELGDLFNKEHRRWLCRALNGMPSSWHSRTLDVELKRYATYEALTEEIETAATLGSEVISVHYIGQDLTVHSYTGKNSDFVKRILRYASDSGVKLALETTNLHTMKRAINDFDELGVCLDPAAIRAHSHHSLQEFTQVTKERICYLHLYDSRVDDGHLTPGTGDIPRDDWQHMLEILWEINYRGPAVLEIKPPPEKSDQTPLEAAIEAREFFDRLG